MREISGLKALAIGHSGAVKRTIECSPFLGFNGFAVVPSTVLSESSATLVQCFEKHPLFPLNGLERQPETPAKNHEDVSNEE